MLTISIKACLLLLVATSFPALAQSVSPQEAARLFAHSLRNVSTVEFYFLSRTEDWNYKPSEIVEHSSVRAYRACGGNCHNFMEPVLLHLRNAKPSACVSGQQNAIIFGKAGWALIYSHSGQQIKFGPHCYWNPQGIKKVVAGNSMLFGG